MNFRIIGALLTKDFILFFRNRMFAILTVLGIAVYVLVYFIMPHSVDETLDIGLFTPEPASIFKMTPQQGLEITAIETEELLKDAVRKGDVIAGITLPEGFAEMLHQGQTPGITVYFASDTPEESRTAVETLIRGLSALQVGQMVRIDLSEEVLGRDMAGMQIPPRERLRSLFAVFLVLTESLFLASLVSEEIERRTIQALLVTPTTTRDIFISKGMLGISLAFSQAALFLAIAGGMSRQPLIIIVALMLGAMLVAGIGFLVASVAKDFMSVLAWSMIPLIVLFIPSFSIVFPGVLSGWVKFIPSYYLVDTVHQAASFGSGWGDVWLNLILLLGINAVLLGAGVIALRRRFQ